MVDVARVNLYGQPIGSVRWDQRYEVAQFEYDPDFVRLGIEPSSLMMPVRKGRVYSFGELDKTTFKGLPGMLADSLPDTYGRALFEKWLALTGRTSSNAIETLCFLGKRCMGALEFEPAGNAPRQSLPTTNLPERSVRDRSRLLAGSTTTSSSRMVYPQRPDSGRRKTSGVWNTPSHVL